MILINVKKAFDAINNKNGVHRVSKTLNNVAFINAQYTKIHLEIAMSVFFINNMSQARA